MKSLQIISAPSILGLRPGGVERLPNSLLSHGLIDKLSVFRPVLAIQTLNSNYSFERDKTTQCLNPGNIKTFSIRLANALSGVLEQNLFPLVLGGDCSILIGILPALKKTGNYGLLFCDAHADFYQPEKSTTGELADMDLAIVTGRGPELLTNINGLQPYVIDEHVIHVGQRDWEETKKYGSQDIRETAICRFDYESIQKIGIRGSIRKIIERMDHLPVDAFWIHFDTDVLSDDENPAVDYRLPGGITFQECEELLKSLIHTGKIAGMSVTIFNPGLDDEEGTISRKLSTLLRTIF